uniref:Immunoglobulin V-set domain-containing protein n=1 Tax=Oryzias latipes TaxID=8090 RepID=A0A3P9LV38_ORYLA
ILWRSGGSPRLQLLRLMGSGESWLDSLVDAETNIYTKHEGEDITVRCNLTFSGSRKLLCKETCEEGNILIATYRDKAQRGRYSMKYEYRYIRSSILDVTITKLTKSDSGLEAIRNFQFTLSKAFSASSDSTVISWFSMVAKSIILTTHFLNSSQLQ